MGRARFVIDLEFLARVLELPADVHIEHVNGVLDFPGPAAAGVESCQVTISSPALRDVAENDVPPLVVPKLHRAPSVLTWTVDVEVSPGVKVERTLGHGRAR